MYCEKCGRQANLNEKYCANCGNMIKGNQQKKKNTAAIIITIVAIFYILLLFLGFAMCSGIVGYFTNDCYPSTC